MVGCLSLQFQSQHLQTYGVQPLKWRMPLLLTCHRLCVIEFIVNLYIFVQLFVQQGCSVCIRTSIGIVC
jgi:hypothetical protein